MYSYDGVELLVDDVLMDMLTRLEKSDKDSSLLLMQEIIIWLTLHVSDLHNCLEENGVSREDVIEYLEKSNNQRVVH
jgi:hypothetical protein|tara:strand:+ start:430 stop:660 length:231 start_codon:yes stop_codon:yes gene_type:complete